MDIPVEYLLEGNGIARKLPNMFRHRLFAWVVIITSGKYWDTVLKSTNNGASVGVWAAVYGW